MYKLLKFKVYLESTTLQGHQDLPPIPTGMARVQHTTGRRVADLILSGKNFDYSKGSLSSTADFFSTNEEVWKFIETGRVGAFTRDAFGDTIILMDMPYNHLKIHNQIGGGEDGMVDNKQVVGIIDKTTKQFIPNPRYDPHSVEIEDQRKTTWPFGGGKEQPVMPSPLDNSGEVWK
jgi:hypothetical protein